MPYRLRSPWVYLEFEIDSTCRKCRSEYYVPGLNLAREKTKDLVTKKHITKLLSGALDITQHNRHRVK
jgi:hypothetical protein